MASISQALTDSIGDVKQFLHIAPTRLPNFLNIYQPAQGTLSGALALEQLRRPNLVPMRRNSGRFAAKRRQSSKLCVQYLAPIIKNRQYNFPPLGINPFVGASARPNELTYSEDWMRPDHVPPQTAQAPGPPPGAQTPVPAGPPPGARPTDPKAGLLGIMAPPGGGQ